MDINKVASFRAKDMPCRQDSAALAPAYPSHNAMASGGIEKTSMTCAVTSTVAGSNSSALSANWAAISLMSHQPSRLRLNAPKPPLSFCAPVEHGRMRGGRSGGRTQYVRRARRKAEIGVPLHSHHAPRPLCPPAGSALEFDPTGRSLFPPSTQPPSPTSLPTPSSPARPPRAWPLGARRADKGHLSSPMATCGSHRAAGELGDRRSAVLKTPHSPSRPFKAHARTCMVSIQRRAQSRASSSG